MRNVLYNFVVNFLESSTHGFSLGFVSFNTIFPIFINHLTDNKILIGLIASISGSAFLFPQLFIADYVEGLRYKKPIIVKASFWLERLPFLFLSIITVNIFEYRSEIILFVIFFCVTVQGLGEGIVVVAWRDMLSKIFPTARHGSIFGILHASDTIFGVVGAGIASYVLLKMKFPYNYSILFLITFIGLTLGIPFILLIHENPIIRDKIKRKSKIINISKITYIIKNDKNFKNFLISRALYGLGRMCIGFIAVYLVNYHYAKDHEIAILTVYLFISQTIFFLVLGYLSDKVGHKTVIVIGLLSGLLSIVLTISGASFVMNRLVYISLGVMLSTEILSSQIIVFKFSTEDDRSTYIGLANTVFGVFAVISPVLGGIIINLFGYKILYLTSITFFILAIFISLIYVKEPEVVHVVSTG